MAGFLSKLFGKKGEGAVQYEIKAYPDTPTAFAASADGSVPLYFGEDLLKNPDRGFRGELYLTLGRVRAYPPTEENPYERLERETKLYGGDGALVYQLYVYLCDYYKRPLDETAFSQLQAYLEEIKKRGLRVLLRFAYEYDSFKKGPTDKQIGKHTVQLAAWMREHKDLVDSTVYAMQFGTIGLWGEGHGSCHKHNIPAVLQMVFDMIPEDMTLMVRTPNLMQGVSEKNEAKVSFHDDFLVGIEHIWGMIPFDHPAYIPMLRKCKFSITDGEMPWGRDTTVPVIDPILLIKQCVGYGLRTLSAEHNYKEEGKLYHLEAWKNVFLTEGELLDNRFPYLPAALTNGRISVFDYLKYHVGYLLAASNLKTADGFAEFDVFNFGFSAPIDFKMEILSGEEALPQDFDMTELRQFSVKHFKVPYTGGSLAVRFTHIRDNTLHIKLANDVPYADGVNVLLK